MNIKIICVGKLKEKFLQDASKEYEKRLGRFCKLEIIEIPDRKNPDMESKKLCLEVMEKEGRDILSKIKQEYVIALCIEGKKLSSEALADKIEKLKGTAGKITFIIGGSLGLSDEVKERADEKISFSDMTFPHGLARVLLLEQVYRGFKIISGESYHK